MVNKFWHTVISVAWLGETIFQMIAIINYGVGNIFAFQTVFKRLNVPAKVITEPKQLNGVTGLVLPGVGAFDHTMTRFNESGLRSAVEECVMVRKTPILGVCVGMQMLGESSEEGSMPGLGWVRGRVLSFANHSSCSQLPSPHMGWNDVTFPSGQLLGSDSEESQRFYFLHSYYFKALNRSEVAATAHYGFTFDAAVQKGNIFGVQFHPEKSHSWGLRILQKFSEL